MMPPPPPPPPPRGGGFFFFPLHPGGVNFSIARNKKKEYHSTPVFSFFIARDASMPSIIFVHRIARRTHGQVWHFGQNTVPRPPIFFLTNWVLQRRHGS